MQCTAKQDAEQFDLIESLDREWLKLPLAVMRDVGPATQTLAGLLKITNRETFAAVADIARKARLPIKTVRKHLDTLVASGWIINAGRQHTRRGAPRRTCTLRITAATTTAISESTNGELIYGLLPWWACCDGGKIEMPWSAKAVLSIVMARLASLKKTVQDLNGKGDTYPDEFWGSIANLGGEDQFRFSLLRLEALTGLDHKSITKAKRVLHGLKIVEWYADQRDDGGDAKDMLAPSEAFQIVVTPAGEGRCHVAFRGDGKTGQ